MRQTSLSFGKKNIETPTGHQSKDVKQVQAEQSKAKSPLTSPQKATRSGHQYGDKSPKKSIQPVQRSSPLKTKPITPTQVQHSAPPAQIQQKSEQMNVEMKEASDSEEVLTRRRKFSKKIIDTDQSEEEIVRKPKKRTQKESDSEEVINNNKKRTYQDITSEFSYTKKPKTQKVEQSTGITPAMDKLNLKKNIPSSQQSIPDFSQGDSNKQRFKSSAPTRGDTKDENEIPDNLLEGLTIVLSGVFEGLAREKLEYFINQHGGRCTSAISGKTTHLIIGVRLEDGREVTQGNKYRTAKDKGTQILTEADFEKLIQQMSGNDKFTLSMRKSGLLDMIPEVVSPVKSVIDTNSDTLKTEMWTDRYKPRSVYDLIGNQAVIDQLYEWLKDWDEVCIRGNKKQVNFRRGMSWGDTPNINARAALLSGPPGIGKTSTARIVCAQLGYEVVEQNASDTRNKASLELAIKDLSTNKSLNYFSVAGRKKESENTNALAAAIGGLATQKSVIIMDEVDGVGAGDRGGIAALIKIIKESKTPIICICNDRQERKLQSLVNHCYDLKFQRPSLDSIRKKLSGIAKSEGFNIEDQVLDKLIESSGNDIRQVINTLQMWNIDGSNGKSIKSSGQKDDKVMINNFEAAHRLLNCGAQSLQIKYPSFRDKLDLFFVDHEWIPLLVQESYLTTMEKRNTLADVEAMAQASEFISLGDSLNRQLRINQDWSLLPDLGIFSSIAPCLTAQGRSFYPAFPQWLGKNSSQRKSMRQIRELKQAMGPQAYAPRRSIQQEYVPLILLEILKLLQKDRVEAAISLMEQMNITNEMMKEHLIELCMNHQITDQFEKLSTQQKSSFTREWNKGHQDPTKGVRGKKITGKGQAADDQVSDEEEEYDEMLDEEQINEMKKAKIKQKEMAEAQKNDKTTSKFEMIKADLGDDGAAGKKGKAKSKAKAKTKAGKKRDDVIDSDDSLADFIDDDDSLDKKKKAKTAVGKKR